MNAILLTRGWSKKIDLTGLREWCRQRLILEDDWSFEWKDINADVNGILKFRYEDDALAFKLTFGL